MFPRARQLTCIRTRQESSRVCMKLFTAADQAFGIYNLFTCSKVVAGVGVSSFQYMGQVANLQMFAGTVRALLPWQWHEGWSMVLIHVLNTVSPLPINTSLSLMPINVIHLCAPNRCRVYSDPHFPLRRFLL